jgi:transposase
VYRRKRGDATGPNPTDRGKAGTKHHVLVEAQGIPVAVTLTAANVHDSRAFEEVLDAIPAIKGPGGQLRKRPGKLHADEAYDFACCRQALRQREIQSRIARRSIESSRAGRHRWVVERTLAWLARFRRLPIRYERRADIHQAFLTLTVC